jgi:hypothetical protein
LAPPGAFIQGNNMIPQTILEKKNHIAEINLDSLDQDTFRSLKKRTRNFMIDNSIYIVCKDVDLLFLRLHLDQELKLIDYKQRRNIFKLLTALTYY